MNIEKNNFFNEMQQWIVAKCGVEENEFDINTDLIDTGILDSLKLILFYAHAESLSGETMDAKRIESLDQVSIVTIYNVLNKQRDEVI